MMPYGSVMFFPPLRTVCEHSKIYDLSREPIPAGNEPIKIGDVGYINNGQFHLLFHAGTRLEDVELGVNVPSSFEPLLIGKTVFRVPREPEPLHTDTVREVEITLDAVDLESTAPYVPSLGLSSTCLKMSHAGPRIHAAPRIPAHVSHTSSLGITVQH